MHRGGGAALTPPTNNARWRSSSTCICGAYSYLTYMYKYCANEALSSFGFVPLAQAQTSQEGRPSAHAALWAGFGLIKWAWSKIFAALTRGYTVQKPLSIDPAYAPECTHTCTHKHIHTCTHTHTYTHAHTHLQRVPVNTYQVAKEKGDRSSFVVITVFQS